jgi:hypothetical protein
MASVMSMAELHSFSAPDDMSATFSIDLTQVGTQGYPYSRLDPDDYERLAYALFDASAPNDLTRFWQRATLMTRGADAGKDVALFFGESLAGVVQCKRLGAGIALPAVMVEIAKLILFASIPGGTELGADFTYVLTNGESSHIS